MEQKDISHCFLGADTNRERTASLITDTGDLVRVFPGDNMDANAQKQTALQDPNSLIFNVFYLRLLDMSTFQQFEGAMWRLRR